MFLWEYPLGAFAASLLAPLPFKDLLRSDTTSKALSVALVGYALFLAGYGMQHIWSRSGDVLEDQDATAQAASGVLWNRRYSTAIFVAIILTIGLGFVQFLQRVRLAGGLLEFGLTAYQYRFGTYGQSPEGNAFIAMANILGSLASGFVGIAVLAGLKGKLRKYETFLLIFLTGILMTSQALQTYRGALLFTTISLAGLCYSERRTARRGLIIFTVGFVLLTIGINYSHQYLYYRTAGWDYQDILETMQVLIAPRNHLENLSRILQTHDTSAGLLWGRGLLEAIFFFVPRVMWTNKALSEEYGTILVQTWANMPDSYQIAITDVGELIAHFGYLGILGMILYGCAARYFDSFQHGSLEFRSAFYMLILPRTWVHISMGFSAFSLTIFSLAIFLAGSRLLAKCLTHEVKDLHPRLGDSMGSAHSARISIWLREQSREEPQQGTR